jgi:hypothetical protein
MTTVHSDHSNDCIGISIGNLVMFGLPASAID